MSAEHTVRIQAIEHDGMVICRAWCFCGWKGQRYGDVKRSVAELGARQEADAHMGQHFEPSAPPNESMFQVAARMLNTRIFKARN